MSTDDKSPTPPPPDAASVALTESVLQQMESFRVTHKTQVLTILFTDLVDSTALQDKLGNARAAQLVQQHKSVFRQVLGPMDGQEVETAGDSFLLVFAVPSEAVKFALRMQAGMRKARQAAADLPGVRVGIHQGQVVVERHEIGPKAMEIYGLQVSTAARIMSLAAGGQILCSRAIFDDARVILRGDDFAGLAPVAWRNHGPYKFKGVEDPYDVCEVGEEGLAPLTAPPSGDKAWPAGRGEEELGWRPAAGVIVPGTKWVLQERLGKEDKNQEQAAKFRGEFGEVWKAWNPGLKSHQVFKFCFKRERVSALKREARLLKMLQAHRHPNLVEVHDVTEGDRPPFFLEMEYVEGPSLEDWLATNPPLKDRLEIVAQVADALDTVHAAGIYHRDIKPSNILLTHRQDGALQAKLADFGLGAAEDKELLQSIEVSRVQSVAGTWDYIAPELRSGGTASPQSDIYSLGLTLFQIVAGDLKSPAGPGWECQVPDEILRGDIARCMDSQPKNRWPRAGELARALRSHDDRLQRLELERQHQAQQKRTRRLKVICGVVGLFAAITVGLGGMAWHQRNVAEAQRQEAQRQRDIADEQRKAAVGARSTSDHLFAAGRQFADFVILDLSKALTKVSGTTSVRKVLVDKSLDYLQTLWHYTGDDYTLQRSIATAYVAIGDVQGNPYNANLGDANGALASYRKSLEIAQRLAAAEPNNAVLQGDLSVGLERIGDMLTLTGDINGAMESYRKDVAIIQRLADADPNNAQAQQDLSVSLAKLGNTYARTNDVQQALLNYRKSLAINQRRCVADANSAEAQRDLASSYLCIGDILMKTGDANAAIDNFFRSVTICQNLVDAGKADLQTQQILPAVLIRLGNVQFCKGDTPGAMGYFQKSLAISQKLADADPNNAEAQRNLSISLDNVADMQAQTNDFAGALASYQKSVEISRQLAAAASTNAEAQRDLAIGLEKVGALQFRMGDASAALGNYRQALVIVQGLADGDSKDSIAQATLASVLQQIGDVLSATGDFSGAMDSYNKALKIAEGLVKLDSSDVAIKQLRDSIAKSIQACQTRAASKPAQPAGTTSQPAGGHLRPSPFQ